MNESQAELVQASFSRVFARKAELAGRFYHHLFVAIPEVGPLFERNFGIQKEMFSAMLALVVRGLAQPSAFESVSGNLQSQHERFNISRFQWQAAGNALVLSLRDVLQEELSASEDAAWVEATGLLVVAMTSSKFEGPLTNEVPLP